MGYLRKRLIKNPEKRFKINIIVDIVLIASLLFMAFNCKYEWNAGYLACEQRHNKSVSFEINITGIDNFSTRNSGHQNITPDKDCNMSQAQTEPQTDN